MIKQLVTKVLGTRFARELKRVQPTVDAIHRHEARLKELSDAEVQAQTAAFRERIAQRTAALAAEVARLRQAKHDCPDADERLRLDAELSKAETALHAETGQALDDLLPEAFATVREACRRLVGTDVAVTGHALVWDMVPYDVQLIGGIVLHQGKIAEMATGEGKTLVATLPLYLNALAGRGAHLVTVNNYLARRDSQWMGHLFTWLGLTVGCIDDTPPQSPERHAAYRCDITYGTNNEFGFDYLRDNMVFALDQRVQRAHVYAIVDEVDSILVDEARTPLIISGPVGNEADAQVRAAQRPGASARPAPGDRGERRDRPRGAAAREGGDPVRGRRAAVPGAARHAEEQASHEAAQRDRHQAAGAARGAGPAGRSQAAGEQAADASTSRTICSSCSTSAATRSISPTAAWRRCRPRIRRCSSCRTSRTRFTRSSTTTRSTRRRRSSAAARWRRSTR